jgi:electron transfer flavoprotein beta subunit
MTAEFLGIPSVSAVSSITMEGGSFLITREIDGGKESLTVPVPFLAVVQKGIAREPRIAAMRGIMMARTKPVKVFEPVHVEPLTEIVALEKPAPRSACKMVDASEPAKLIGLLRDEAKVI